MAGASGGGVIVVGGGHNGLAAAILAAQQGHHVTVLERGDHVGGATVGARAFAGHPARLSRYSYLIALFPDELVRRLGITVGLASRAVASYTPVHRGGRATGLLVERQGGAVTEASFGEVTGGRADYRAWQRFYGEMSTLATVLAPTLMGRLRTAGQVARAVAEAGADELWTELTTRPLGSIITDRFGDDTVRGVVATDGLIGTHTDLFGQTLLANRCFVYHLIGRGSGEWLVPVGGMGALTDALLARAVGCGVEIRCGVEVVAADETARGVALSVRDRDGRETECAAGHVLAAVAPTVVAGWLGRHEPSPVGAQLKINMLLSRLPRLASGVDPARAFAGTMHLEEGFDDLQRAYRESSGGAIPGPLPCEVYCHSLTDPSILAGERGHTLTLFGLHAPAGLFRADPVGASRLAAESALAALQGHLAEPLEDCLALDSDGRPCLDVATPVDLERTLGMPGGHIFHGDLQWPWRADTEVADTPARRYGVEVPGSFRILMAGAGSRRGGGVSGLGGLAAAEALAELTGRS